MNAPKLKKWFGKVVGGEGEDLSRHDRQQCAYASSVTPGELLYGAHRSRRSEALLERIEAVIPAELPVLPFDAAAARRYGRIRAELESGGTPVGDADLRIAAVALTHGPRVVTGNERHFRRVPDLEVENWLGG